MQPRSRDIQAWIAILTLCVLLVGAVAAANGRLTTVETQQDATEKRVERIESDLSGVTDLMRSIDQRLARIEGKLDKR